MARHLLASCGILLIVVLVSLACSAPADTAPGSPAAQATNVRRTAVAEVQAIIANKSTPTPVPAATATPVPTCQNALWWTDARSHVGESRTVQGTVVATRTDTTGALLIELGQPYPDPTGVLVRVPQAIDPGVQGHTVCATGEILLTNGRVLVQLVNAHALQLKDPS